MEWQDDELHFRKAAPNIPYRFPLTIPGETESIEFGWTFVARPCPPSEFEARPRSLEATMDFGSVRGPLHFRTHNEGDAIGPLGMRGTKKLSDIFQEFRLTTTARKRLPLVCDMIGPVWVPGVCLAERVKITENSEKALNIRLVPHTA